MLLVMRAGVLRYVQLKYSVSCAGGGSSAGVYSAGPGKAQMAQNFMSERLRNELQQRAYMVRLVYEL